MTLQKETITRILPKTIRFLTSNDIIRIHRAAVGLSTRPSQQLMKTLDSAVASAMKITHRDKTHDVFLLAGKLAMKVMKSQAFADGGKRTGLLAADYFLRINGFKLKVGKVLVGGHGMGGYDPDEKLVAVEKAVDEIVSAHVAVMTDRWDARRLGRFYKGIARERMSWEL